MHWQRHCVEVHIYYQSLPKKKSRQVFSTEEREEDQDEDMDTTEANESENEEDQQAEEHSSDEVSRDANLNFSVICHC